MRPISLYIASSLDGFIARPDGSVDWLEAEYLALENEDFGYQAFYDGIDTTLMGGETYRTILGFDVPFPYSDKQNYVVSRRLQPSEVPEAEVVAEDVPDFIRGLKQRAGKGIWLVGGGQLNSLLLEANLLDELILSQVPVLLGRGIPLFSELKQDVSWELLHSTPFANGMVQSHYKRRP